MSTPQATPSATTPLAATTQLAAISPQISGGSQFTPLSNHPPNSPCNIGDPVIKKKPRGRPKGSRNKTLAELGYKTSKLKNDKAQPTEFPESSQFVKKPVRRKKKGPNPYAEFWEAAVEAQVLGNDPLMDDLNCTSPISIPATIPMSPFSTHSQQSISNPEMANMSPISSTSNIGDLISKKTPRGRTKGPRIKTLAELGYNTRKLKTAKGCN